MSNEIFFKLNLTNCDEIISSGDHLGSTGAIRTPLHWWLVGVFSILQWMLVGGSDIYFEVRFIHRRKIETLIDKFISSVILEKSGLR